MATSTSSVNPPKPRKLSALVLALVALCVTGAAAGAYYLGSNRSDTAAAVKPEEPIFIALDPLTVNLQPNGRSRFLHAGVTLKVADAKSQSQITQYLPEVRSRVLTVLSNRESESLITPDDKARLANEIMTSLNQPLTPSQPAQKVSSVVFTTFMLQ